MIDRIRLGSGLLCLLLSATPAIAQRESPANPRYPLYPDRVAKSRTAAPPHSDIFRSLSAAHYSVKRGLRATLMLSNQGPHEMAIHARLFNLAGEALDLDLPPLAAHEVREIALHDVVSADSEWAEGSLDVQFQGKNLELGGVLSLMDEARSLIFDEELTETATHFSSSRLEGVWWAPAPTAQLSVALANTSDLPLAVTARLVGIAPSAEPLQVELAPRASRVLGYADFLARPEATLPRVGGLSLEHSGAPGALLVRALIAEPTLGYSDAAEFVDAERALSSTLHGAGLRLGRFARRGGASLWPALAVRNLSDRPLVVSGRIPVITSNGDVRSISLPRLRLAAREIREIDLVALLRPVGQRRFVTAGIELEHDGAPGSLVAKALSRSGDGTQVYRVPLVDAQRANATGIYPFRLDQGQNARIYLKNVTAEPRDYTLSLTYPEGTYVLGLATLDPHESRTIDLTELRDRQIPDLYGRVLPRRLAAGKALWSMRGEEQHALIGRIEQSDPTRGMSMTAACGACCPNSMTEAFMTPSFAAGYPGDTTRFLIYIAEEDCYGSVRPWYTLPFSSFSSTVPSVATIDSTGLARANGPGSTLFSSTVYGTVYSNCAAEAANDEYCCNEEPVAVPCEATCQVLPRIEIEVAKTPAQNDDVVQVKSTTPARRPKILARARAVGGPPADVTAVLTNPDGRLRFPDAANTTKTLTLPRSGAWVDFELSGESASSAKDDAVIEAHCNSAAGPLCGSEQATVFTFDAASIKVTAVGSFQIVNQGNGAFGPIPSPGVRYESQATLKPAGLDCSVAPIKDLRVGVMQNVEQVSRTYILSDPAVVFDPGVPSGTRSTIPTRMMLTLAVPGKFNDTVPDSAPLFDRPGSNDQIDPNSQVVPGGCGQPTVPVATTSDSPSFTNMFEFQAVIDGTAQRAGMLIYRKVDRVVFQDKFRTWAALWDMTPTGVTMLRETTWDLDVDSQRTTPQKAVPSGTEVAPATSPVINPPYANQLAAGNNYQLFPSNITVLFTKP
ncbi:MAG: hypothetical protein SF066_11315 [Thermoanaerobaculia bacterium]|nr:hypothetical protein [Thermoanaerobaculia bacterium]